MKSISSETKVDTPPSSHLGHYRFHKKLVHLDRIFGNDWFALKAEGFARFFGTPIFLIAQTVIVTLWIVFNISGMVHFDLYPFILLNLAFSLQAAYAAPLILLAQTRQTDRDKAHSEADALHREALAIENRGQQSLIFEQNGQLLDLVRQNTELTKLTRDLSERIEKLTSEVHQKMSLQTR